MSWSYLNAVPNISGGLGLFDKEIVLKIGGYDKNSLGEDMDLVFRMVGYMQETNQPYCVRSVPRTLCWTEGPETLQILVRQRIRWARGLFQILKKNKKVFLNPKYGRMGFIIFPYNLFFEFLSPFVEFIGIFVLIYSYFYDPVAFMNILYLIIAVISFYIGLSFSAVFLDGKIFKSDVIGVERSENGSAGEKNANYDKNKVYGNIKENTPSGIFGEYTDALPDAKKLKVASKDEVKIGPATIRTVINNNEIKELASNAQKHYGVK
jgi:hypothetical protein